MRYDYHLLVLGAGSGGLIAASGARALGAKVALVEAGRMGGDCLNFGCVPSKAFLRSAHLARDLRSCDKLGLDAQLGDVDLGRIMDRVARVISEIEPHDSRQRFEGLGVDVVSGYGQIVDRHSVEVGGKIMTAKSIVLATGSEPKVLPVPGLEQIDYLTNKTIFNLRKLPKRLIVLGAGPIGLELGQGFRHLGSEVFMLDQNPRLFSRDDPEVAGVMEKHLLDEGVALHLGCRLERVAKMGDEVVVTFSQDGESREIRGDQILVSMGRTPQAMGIGIDEVGIKLDRSGYVLTDSQQRTSIPNIFACGDVCGPYQFTHMAAYQAGIVIRNAIFRLRSRVDYANVPWVTFTKPEVAHTGYTEQRARDLGVYRDHEIVNLNDVDRAKCEDDRVGFLKVVLGERGRLVGATLVGDKAGEIIPLASLAINEKYKASKFLNLTFPYPVEAEIFKRAGLALAKKSFRPWMKTVIRRLFL